MEALAASASVAGLVSLAGQCVSGAQTLRNLYRDIKTASKTVDGFLKDLKNLLRTLHEVNALLAKLNAVSSPNTDPSSLENLKTQLEDCRSDLDGWLAMSQAYGRATGRGARAIFRKFWIAVNQDTVKNITMAMQRRRVELMVSLVVVGRFVMTDSDRNVHSSDLGQNLRC